MAGRLLFVILVYSFHEIQVQGQKPLMSLQHFHGDYVLFTCSLPGSTNNDTRCNLYFGEASRPVLTTTIWRRASIKPKHWFCQFTVTTDDLLRHLHSVQQSNASCDYRLGSEPNFLSPRSDGYSLTDIVERESGMPPIQSAFTTTTDLTVSGPGASTVVTFATSTVVTPVKPASDIVEIQSHMTQTKPTFTMTTDVSEIMSHTPRTMSTFTVTTGLTVNKPHASTPVTPAKRTSGLTVGRPRITDISASLKPEKPASETRIWKLLVVAAGFGVTVGVILLGVALLSTKRRTERCSYKRTQASVKGNDETYSVIVSVPGADCPTGSEKLNRQEPQNEHSDIYHVYSTISEEPPPSALKDVVYSTLQAH
ncbi:uncharacterized protein LOC122864660 [Siniperca chuatsi]|uniref:uncharacterized protein LOC122864660 n=1 Tax=Siniperca chuatsi TaxID=119488 RepID=UPI001CE085C2|nr:uncharacterized protein LOC122864660 [Siniperca chuatsi]